MREEEEDEEEEKLDAIELEEEEEEMAMVFFGLFCWLKQSVVVKLGRCKVSLKRPRMEDGSTLSQFSKRPAAEEIASPGKV